MFDSSTCDKKEYYDNNSAHCDSLTDHYVSELIKEGFDREVVVRALAITQNNLDMAKNILREFVPRN